MSTNLYTAIISTFSNGAEWCLVIQKCITFFNTTILICPLQSRHEITSPIFTNVSTMRNWSFVLIYRPQVYPQSSKLSFTKSYFIVHMIISRNICMLLNTSKRLCTIEFDNSFLSFCLQPHKQCNWYIQIQLLPLCYSVSTRTKI